MIRLSCAEYAFPLLPPEKRFKLVRLLGFTHVDVGLFERDSSLKPRQLVAAPMDFTRQLKSEIESAGLHVSDVFLQIGQDPTDAAANDPNPVVRSRNRKTFLQALDLCLALGCAHLTGLPGVLHGPDRDTEDFALAREEASWRSRAAFSAGVTYAIEPHLGSLCSDIAGTRAFVESVPGLTLTLDYGHFVFANIPSDNIHALLPFASHIHARSGAPGELQTPLDKNAIDFTGMIQHLQERKYSGAVAIEYVWTDWQQCNRTDNVSETILLRSMLERLGKSNLRGEQSSERK